MKAMVHEDRVVGVIDGPVVAPEIPAALRGLPLERLRVAHGVVIDGGPDLVPDPVQVAGREARYAIDRAAERARLRFVTPGAAQQAVYLAKDDEARRALADPDPQAADYPLLHASVGIDGATITEVAQAVAAMAAQWRTVAALIERARLAGKAAVVAAEHADDAAALAAARIAALAELDAIGV